jgi:hypothetical protein
MSLADELKKLAELKDAGVLTQEEFDAQKQKLLDGGGSAAPTPAPSQPVKKEAVVPFSLDDLRETLKDPNKEIKSLKDGMWVTELSEDEVDALVERGFGEVRRFAVLSNNIREETLKKLVRDKDIGVREAVALTASKWPEWVVDALVTDDTHERVVQKALTKDPGMSESTAITLAKSCFDKPDSLGFRLARCLYKNPACPGAALDIIVTNDYHFSMDVSQLLGHPNLSETARELLQPPQKASCFPATARVLTPAGTRCIADLEPGDLVISYRPGLAATVQPVTRKLQHCEISILRVALADGTALRVTANHTVLTARGWLRVDQLGEGDLLIQADGSSRVSEVWTEPALKPVYNLHTAGEHNFIVDGVVVHNFTMFRTIRTWMHRLFIDPFHQLGASRERKAALTDRKACG